MGGSFVEYYFKYDGKANEFRYYSNNSQTLCGSILIVNCTISKWSHFGFELRQKETGTQIIFRAIEPADLWIRHFIAVGVESEESPEILLIEYKQLKNSEFGSFVCKITFLDHLVVDFWNPIHQRWEKVTIEKHGDKSFDFCCLVQFFL